MFLSSRFNKHAEGGHRLCSVGAPSRRGHPAAHPALSPHTPSQTLTDPRFPLPASRFPRPADPARPSGHPRRAPPRLPRGGWIPPSSRASWAEPRTLPAPRRSPGAPSRPLGAALGPAGLFVAAPRLLRRVRGRRRPQVVPVEEVGAGGSRFRARAAAP